MLRSFLFSRGGPRIRRRCPGKYNDVSRAAAAGPQPGKKNSEEDHPDGGQMPGKYNAFFSAELVPKLFKNIPSST
jgi:hypothetical protein